MTCLWKFLQEKVHLQKRTINQPVQGNIWTNEYNGTTVEVCCKKWEEPEGYVAKPPENQWNVIWTFNKDNVNKDNVQPSCKKSIDRMCL